MHTVYMVVTLSCTLAILIESKSVSAVQQCRYDSTSNLKTVCWIQGGSCATLTVASNAKSKQTFDKFCGKCPMAVSSFLRYVRIPKVDDF